MNANLIINLALILALALDIFLGFFLIVKSNKNESTFICGIISFCVALWTIGILMFRLTSNIDSAIFWNREFIFTASLIATTFLHFSLAFSGRKLRKSIRVMLYVPNLLILFAVFMPNAFIQEIVIRDWGKESILGYCYPYYGIFWTVYAITAVLFLINFYNKATGYLKLQLLYILSASISTSLIGAYFNLYLILIGNYKYIWVGPYCSFFMVLILTYAILRHRLMDIEVVIKRGLVYSVLMAAIIGIYSLLMFIGQNIFQTAFGINQWIAAIITAFLIAVGYKPLETFITDFTNQYFFRKKYDYQKTLMQSSEAMNLLTDIDRLVRLTTRIVARRMDLVETSTLIYEEPHHRYVVKAAEGKSKEMLGTTFSDNFELFKHLFSTKSILIKDEVSQTLNSKLILHDERKRLSTIKKEMEKLHAQLCIPSITRGKYMGNKLVAVFCMGEKKSGDMYSNEDIQLLTTLSNQAAVAIENALMYSDLMKQFKELKETKDQLVQSEKLAALGTMAAGIAHEIRNPLTSLQLFVQMMAERFDDHEFREKFTQIVPPEIERLNGIVNDLVSFAKPSKLTREPNQINEILEKTIRLSEISFKKLNVKVVRELSEVPKVLVDSQQMMQIFLNLIMNGAQAMQAGGTLTVKSYFNTNSGRVAVDIKDTGTGISEENLKKLFSPFFTTKDKGTGLGLAITRRIVEEHKGEIKVKSKVGEGTTFTVELPIAV